MGEIGGGLRRGVVVLAVLAATLAATAPAGAEDPPSADRYDLVGRCWTVEGGGADGVGPVRFQAVDLGRYLLLDADGRFLSKGGGDAVVRADGPSDAVVWDAVDEAGAGVVLRHPSGGALRPGAPATGCFELPDIATGVSGPLLRGASPVDEVTGFLDSHLHITAFEFLGGKAHCGRPWHPFGVTSALVDCPDHQLADGQAAVLENLLYGGEPIASHDPVGWPSFRDWPAPHSLTHEQTYFRWLERAWQGGLRMIVNLFTDNRVLCELYPLKHNSCDEMDSVRLQAQRIHELVRYIDAQSGGPGEGWMRIVTDPYEARAVMNTGKLAVVLGIELSEPFGCRDAPVVVGCTAEDIDRAIDELHALGIRQMFAIHKFDNALGGVTGDGGVVGSLINGGNFLSTGHFFDMRSCDPGSTGVHDNNQDLPIDTGQLGDVLGTTLAEVLPPGLPPVPVYPPGNHCNTRGLAPLGHHAIQTMIDRGILIDVDHMSVNARQEALDLIEAERYPGVVSSHSWATPDAEPRILDAGGMVSLYGGNSWNFAESWERIRRLVPDGERFGFGYGADSNGLGGQGSPRRGPNPVTYPFTGLGGVTIDRQVSGTRTYDINVDGVAHYGLYPDWIEDLRQLKGDQIVEDLSRGAEAYLRVWERAEGIAAPTCPAAPAVAAIRSGMPAAEVLRLAGQPESRAEGTFTYCNATVQFAADGTVVSLASASRLTESAPRELPVTGGTDSAPALGLLLLVAAALVRRGVSGR